MSAGGRAPRVSVIIATYNWSAALALALQSVLAQTMQDFEVLVVGDACTDDSAEVVASFDDPRLQFFNLETRCGSQWGPNNFALARARGDTIAYLGHDDIWWPDHLETSLAAAAREGADVTAALAILYGPPDSGVFYHSGLFPGSTFRPAYYFVPSSLTHRRALVDRVGPWRPAAEAGRLTDIDFVTRLHEAGARIVETAELTVFKFNAGWRRGAYEQRSVAEQEVLAGRIRAGDGDFRRGELIKVLRSVMEGRGAHFEVRSQPSATAEAERSNLSRFKGADPAITSGAVSALSGSMRFQRTGELLGFEWYGVETGLSGEPFRWSGPATTASIVLPLIPDAPFILWIDVVDVLEAAALETLSLSVNGLRLQHVLQPNGSAWRILCAYTPPADAAIAQSILVSFKIARTLRPIDLGRGDDRRWLGLAVGAIELQPVLRPGA